MPPAPSRSGALGREDKGIPAPDAFLDGMLGKQEKEEQENEEVQDPGREYL